MCEIVKNVGQMPPCDQFRLGHQNDGSGNYCCVLVETPHGRIPGKGKQGEAWYPYGGKEHSSKNFFFLKAKSGTRITLQKSRNPPHGSLPAGKQKDSGTYYSVVCHHSGHGNVPGKSDGKNGWYIWGGKEHMTGDFSYVVVEVIPVVKPAIKHTVEDCFGDLHLGGNMGNFGSPFTSRIAPIHTGGGFVAPSVPPQVPGFNPAPSVPPQGPGFNPRYGTVVPPAAPAGYAPQYIPPKLNYPVPPSNGLSQGMSVRFVCKSGRNMRLKGCGEVDGEGGNGNFATFTVQVMGQGRYSFQNKNGQWLAIKFGNITHSAMYGDRDAIFLLHLNPDNSISLESSTMPGTFLGISKVGRSKLSGYEKPSAKFYLIVV